MSTEDPSEGKESSYLKLVNLLRLDQKDNIDGVLSAQALLSNTNANQSAAMNARQNEAAINAYWKSKCGDAYEQPSEDAMGSNFVNCSIVSDKAIEQLATIINDPDMPGTNPPTQPPTQPLPPGNKTPWWKIVLTTLLAVLLGAALILLAWRQFGGELGQYELIAEPFEPPEPIEYEQ